MSRLPLAARLFIVGVIVAGAAVSVKCLPHAPFAEPLLLAAFVFLSSATATMKVHLPLTTSDSTMSVSYAVDFMSLLMLGPHETMIVTAVGAFSQCNLRSKQTTPLYRTFFSMASLVITVQAAGLVFSLLGGHVGPQTALVPLARPLVGAATTYFLVNTGLVAAAIALSSRQRLDVVWQANFLWSAPSYFIGAAVAAVAANAVHHSGYWLAPLTFAPLYLTYRTYKLYMGRIEAQQRHVEQTSELHLATIEALARAIDAKDQTAQTHIRRVQLYAAGLARAVGLSDPEIQGIKTAALLHDIGKLAVPEHILSKPGPLTQEEFQKIRIHPQVGAEILAAVPFPYPVAPLILSHHERWDGKGYPHGLKGEDIPIGARILTIVDYYDAITTERPYHKALGPDGAVGLLRHESGRALDPQLVDRFVELLPALREASAEEERRRAPEAPLRIPAPGGRATGRVSDAATQSAFENIALAHREIYALYEIAQTMGTSLGIADTMALISSKLTNLVPWSGCALFLLQSDETLKCRFAAGVEAPTLRDATLKTGVGLAGWVARNLRTIVNGDPCATFEAAGLAPPQNLRSAIVCPLFFADTFMGALALYHTEPYRYTDDHRRLLERIAEQAGAVLHNSIVFEQTQEDSLTDPLTGLPNRRSMFVHLSRELARAERMKTEVAVIVMDIDEFKTINDTYGHQTGDRALREVSRALRGGLRPYDFCVRYAGDEFIVVLVGCSQQAVEAKRAELKERVAAIRMDVRPGRPLPLSVSAGASVFPYDGSTYEQLLAEADHRMYHDKGVRRAHLDIAGAAAPPAADAPDLAAPLVQPVAG
ncbi:MAG: diguanylate cyclase [Betaproteobacteria bacterium]